jgi:hypothetical protein
MRLDMASHYTPKGLQELAEIITKARAQRSYRAFEAITQVSHATIRRLERAEVKAPATETLSKLAPHTPYHLEELIAIAQERKMPNIKRYQTAEDALPIINQLSDTEAARLAQQIVGRLAKVNAMVSDLPPNDGLLFQIRVMDTEQLAGMLESLASSLRSRKDQHQELTFITDTLPTHPHLGETPASGEIR